MFKKVKKEETYFDKRIRSPRNVHGRNFVSFHYFHSKRSKKGDRDRTGDRKMTRDRDRDRDMDSNRDRDRDRFYYISMNSFRPFL